MSASRTPRRTRRTPRAADADRPELDRLHDARSPSRYVAVEELARGGMGVVLHVWDTLLQRPIAMKVLDLDALPRNAARRNAAIGRFLREARVAARLQHPGVIPIHDMGAESDGRVYFTMPLIHGLPLSQVFDLARVGAEGWSLTRALAALTRVCEVIAYAHSRGVIHRDLKPANVMVGQSGEIYVVDWGLAKLVEGAEHGPAGKPSRSGKVAGTPPYMAPEQADGRTAEVSFASDVYALGALLYRLLAGRGPYVPRHGREDAAKTLTLIRRGPATPLHRLAPEAPAELLAIGEKAMARRPEDRHASVEDLARELQAFLDGPARKGSLRAMARTLARPAP